MYIDKGIKVCRPGLYSSIKPGDSVIINPALLKVRNRTTVYPPLSILTQREERCETVESPAWIDEYRITGKERLESGSGRLISIRGEVKVEEPKFVPGFTFLKISPTFEGEIYEECEGIPLITVSGRPFLALLKGGVRLCIKEPKPLLIALAYSAFYYL